MTAVVPVVYPWDVLGAPRLPDELRSLGAERVIVAAQYHSVKAATPRHPAHQLIDARFSALYTGDSFHEGALRAASPQWCTPDAFPQAMQSLRAEGFAVDAFIAPAHDDGAEGEDRDAHRVRNAFGNVLGHALCVNDPVATSFIDRIVDAILAVRPDGLVVESISQLGIDHADGHDKTAGADWSIGQRRLLSLCFCADCEARYDAAGGDPDRMRSQITAAFAPGRSPAAGALCEAFAPLMRAARGPALAARWARCATAAAEAGLTSVSLHACTDEWATGPSAPIPLLSDALTARPADAELGPAAGSDRLVAHCWAETASAAAEVKALAAVSAGEHAHPTVAAYVTVLPPAAADASALAAKWAVLREAGAHELHLYHLGLASEQRLRATREALRILSRRDSPGGYAS